MRIHPFVLAVLLLAVMSPTRAATHYLTLVNDDAVSALAIEATPQGSSTAQRLDTAGALQGGRAGQATVSFPSGVCLVTLRVTYADRGPLTITDWNVCRQSVLYLGQARRAGLRQREDALP
ncbi:hypothetical protein [Xanthomonas sp. NCPPB 2632]|uniref:hypothetical protein n=1 Tax=Xanthomonas sp. NCPPB 2632 TaxID=3240912 RepID=UPI003518B96E